MVCHGSVHYACAVHAAPDAVCKGIKRWNSAKAPQQHWKEYSAGKQSARIRGNDEQKT